MAQHTTSGPDFLRVKSAKKGPGFYVLAVQDAGWEHVKKFDIGFDMMLFNQLNITFDYFHDKRERILMSRASAFYVGILGIKTTE